MNQMNITFLVHGVKNDGRLVFDFKRFEFRAKD